MKIQWEKAPDFLGWNKIRSLRKAKGLTQAKFAVGCGLCIATVYSLEQGHDERTSDEIKQKIADFFECDIDDLFPCQWIGNEPQAEFLRKVVKGEGQPIMK